MILIVSLLVIIQNNERRPVQVLKT